MTIDTLDIKVTRSNRKTVSIFVERDGTLSARIPDTYTDEQFDAVIKSREYQIYKNLAEWELLNANKKERSFISGQSFMYLGKNYRLLLVAEHFKGIKLKNGYFLLSRAHQDKAETYFKDFYKSKLVQKLPNILADYQQKLGVQPAKVTCMELQYRWASCTPEGNLCFHWKCAMAPIETIHYIAAHELAHLIHPNHGPEFWNTLDKIFPTYQQQINWLRVNGAGMSL